jgi:hypothetical protein
MAHGIYPNARMSCFEVADIRINMALLNVSPWVAAVIAEGRLCAANSSNAEVAIG